MNSLDVIIAANINASARNRVDDFIEIAREVMVAPIANNGDHVLIPVATVDRIKQLFHDIRVEATPVPQPEAQSAEA